MTETSNYPQDHEIKVVWTKFIISLLTISTISLWSVFFYLNPIICDIEKSKFLSTTGLYIDIIGVVIASLKTPYYGIFYDGGEIEVKRARAEEKYFKIGMLLIGFGFFLQAMGSIFSN